jgi:hypothetical protein
LEFRNPFVFLTKTFNLNTNTVPIKNDPKNRSFKHDHILYANYPNPFNTATNIPFEIGGNELQQTIITVYNIIGQIIKTVLDQKMTPGVHQIIWDGTDNQGRPVSSGLYLFEMRTQNVIMMGKMFLLK